MGNWFQKDNCIQGDTVAFAGFNPWEPSFEEVALVTHLCFNPWFGFLAVTKTLHWLPWLLMAGERKELL